MKIYQYDSLEDTNEALHKFEEEGREISDVQICPGLDWAPDSFFVIVGGKNSQEFRK